MTQRRKNFCIYYVKCFNATKAYQEAYGCTREDADKRGSMLLKIEEVKQYINELLKNKELSLLNQTEEGAKMENKTIEELSRIVTGKQIGRAHV